MRGPAQRIVADLDAGTPVGVLDPDDLAVPATGVGVRFVDVARLRRPGPDVVPVVPCDRLDRVDGPALGSGTVAVALRTVADLAALAGVRAGVLVAPPSLHGTGAAGDAAVAAVVAYATAVGADVLAVGIDDPIRLEHLRTAGVRLGAGVHVDERLGCRDGLHVGRTPVERQAALHARLAAVADGHEALRATCEHVASLGLLPSVYVERDGAMRCVAQSGYWQVLDGIPVTRGIIARCLREGADQLVTVQADGEFIEAIPGLVAELAQPLRLEGRVRGVFSVESQRHLDPPTVLELGRIGAELQRTLDRVGLHLPDGALHRLARASSELTGLRTGLEVADTAVRLGAELSRTSSAALALPGDDGSHAVVASTGPLGPSLHATPPGPLGALVEELRDIASCTSSGTTAGEVNAAVATLRDTGAATLGLFPVRRDDGSTGLLVVADERPVDLDLELRQALELLALSTGRALEHAAAVEALRRRAEIDPLTEVGSRAAFEDRLAELEAGDATGVSVLLVDLDRFKAVNDRYGHLVGDQVLADVAQAMRGVLAEGEDVYRIGGDEFAVVVPQRTSASIDLLVERLGRECDRTLVPFGASASVGVARRRATEAMEACLQRADRQLYERKATARA